MNFCFNNRITNSTIYLLIYVGAFASKTPSKGLGKSSKETLFAQMSVLQNGQFAPNSSF
jgi:hypothetical protein